MIPDISQTEMPLNQLFSCEFLHTLLNELITTNRNMIRKVHHRIYESELAHTCRRNSRSRLVRTSQLPCRMFQDVVKLVEYVHGLRGQVDSDEKAPLSMTMDELQLEYQSCLAQNLQNLQKSMINRNRAVQMTIDRYACDYYTLLQRSSLTSSNEESSEEDQRESIRNGMGRQV